jgi:hypothetical protein
MKRPREMTVAAVVAFIGSGLFILSGILIGVYVHNLVHSLMQKYPGVSFRASVDPVIPTLKNIALGAIIAPICLGVIGIISGLGVLRMRPWARICLIGWCIASSLACFLAFFYPGRESEFRINPAAILALMLVLIPINAWWLMLFLRPAVKERIAPPRVSPQISQRAKVQKLLTPTRIALAIAVILVAAGLLRLNWLHSPMREIERSEAAVGHAKSWHYHTVLVFPGDAPETLDEDTFCPSFQRTLRKGTGQDGTPRVIDSINFLGRVYGYAGDEWRLSQGRQVDMNAQGSIPIFECLKGTMGNDSNSLPYAAIIQDGTVRRGAVRNVRGESCTDYEIAVATPHDPEEKEFRFAMCINEEDHLPRETRRTPPGSDEESISDYTQWNALSKPDLPEGFPD